MLDRSKQCPINSMAACSHSDSLISLGLTTPEVFYAYDSQSGPHGKLMRQLLEEMLKEFELRLYAFDLARLSASYYFCNICRKIQEAAFMIADIGNWDAQAERYRSNPNVTLEIGLAWGFKKEVILITQEGGLSQLPSDFLGMDVCRYPSDFSSGKIKEAIAEVANRVISFEKFKIVHGGEEFYEIASKIMSLEGDRLLVSRYLTALVKPEALIENLAEEKYGADEEKKRHYIEKAKARTSQLLSQLEKGYEVRDIYEKSGLEDYIVMRRRKDRVNIPASEIKQRIDMLMDLLQEYDNYKVGLTAERIPFIYEIKADKIVTVDSNISKERGDYCGMYFASEGIVREFKSEFNRMWSNIKPEDKTKEQVVGWLRVQREKLSSS